MISAEAEAVMMQYARAFASAVERELSGGDLPFEEPELLDLITRKVDTLPKKRVRIAGLHVWTGGAVSSGSMPAVQPVGNNNPTVPAMRAVRGNDGEERTAKPGETSPRIQAASRSTTPPASSRSRAPFNSSYSGTGSPESTHRLLRPTVTELTAQKPSSVSESGPPSSASSRNFRTSAPASGRRPILNTERVLAAARRAPASQPSPMVSGTLPAAEPKIRTASGFSRAVSASSEGIGTALGQQLGCAVRDAAAGLLFASLEAAHSTMQDPLRFLEASEDPTARQGLVAEGCVCVCYLLYEALTRTEVPQMRAIELVQGACTQALGGGNSPVNDIGRYLASANPREELSRRLCELLGTRETRDLQQRIDSALRTLRAEVRECAQLIQTRMAADAARTASTG